MREFTKEDAQRLIDKMRINYGKKFIDQWAGVHEDELKQAMVDAYQGLTVEDFARGVNRMKHEQWPPTIPEFRSWCEPKTDDWLGSHEAWAIAEKSIGFDGQELTVIWTEQMAQAFSRCEELIKTGDKYQRAEAKKIFCDAYDRLVTQAKDQGLKPIYVTSLGTDKDQAIAAIKQAEVDGFLKAPEAALQLEHKQTKAEIQSDSLKYKTIAQEALAKLAPHIKRNVNKMTEEVKETQPWESMEMQHIDPFDDFEEYKAALQSEQKKLPQAVRFLDEKVGGGV
ncbi:hypothetical protein [Acinetobacter johnsonii]|uniref:Uncharacterized protein n=1 Tax=Acinetobacter johnsonii TaxID=40214 RepID=A0A380U551_ACIJO|nr:hypothetical protein [Acinetobacter johnsonii]ENU39279.1 hypothetical protein F986_02062 [Acinetobacter johnsonii CIP 64.6]QPS04828.1 hypothetical protein I6G67_05035 [Acinetobacter johnsonii]SUT95487.1 Uncharacterised protein [Acinetobacter johnsonii]